MERVILHCDINNFYASVECLKNPELFNVPLAVCGDPALRHGIVLAKNYPAKKFGIKTGDTVGEALKKCPGLLLVKPNFLEYEEFSNKVFHIYTRYTDRVEPYGPDECWLDVTGCRAIGTGIEIADELRRVIRQETGLTISAGVSFNKPFAKLGSDMKKPDATTVISRERFKEILYGLPASDIFMVGPRTADKLRLMNINTIGDLANAEDFVITNKLGKFGQMIQAYSRGEDDTPVRMYYLSRKIESVGHGTTTIRDVHTYGEAWQVILALSEMVGSRLRKYGYMGEVVNLSLRDSSLATVNRQKKMQKSCNGLDIASACMTLCRENYIPGKSLPLRTISVSVGNLSGIEDIAQQSLFMDEQLKKLKSDSCIDSINKKYGTKTIYRAALIDSGLIVGKTTAEDFLPFKR